MGGVAVVDGSDTAGVPGGAGVLAGEYRQYPRGSELAMNWDAWIPLMVVASSLVPGLIIFGLAEDRVRTRIVLNLFGALFKFILVAWMLWGVVHEHHYETRLVLLPGLELVLRAGPLSLLFVTLSTILWLVTTVYAIGYLEDSPHRSRFFGFFSLCVTATVGVALAGNLITFLIFYELLTLSTYPLVVHRGTEVARRAGQTYLAYTIAGGALLLLGTVWLYSLTGTLEFTPRGFLNGLDAEHRPALIIIFALLIAGFRCKSGAGAVAWLVAAGHGCAGAGECPVACGGRGEGRCFRHCACRL